MADNYDKDNQATGYSESDSINGGEHIASTLYVNESLKSVTEVVTTTTNGLMISTDKVKLDGVETEANKYIHPANHPPSIITQDSNNRFVTDAERVKLDGVETEANKYIHPANHPPSIITQDSNNRFVTDAEKSSWNDKAIIGSTGSWTGLTLVNSWVVHGVPNATPSYRKDQFNKLKLKGVVKDGTTTSPTVIANLPSGNRPSEDLTFIVLSNNGTNDIVGRVTITSAGDIQFISGSNTLLSLDSIPEIYVS